MAILESARLVGAHIAVWGWSPGSGLPERSVGWYGSARYSGRVSGFSGNSGGTAEIISP